MVLEMGFASNYYYTMSLLGRIHIEVIYVLSNYYHLFTIIYTLLCILQ